MENIQRTQNPNRPGVSTFQNDIRPIEDALTYMRTYAREKPEMAALWCFGIGFVLGWKLKPW